MSRLASPPEGDRPPVARALARLEGVTSHASTRRAFITQAGALAGTAALSAYAPSAAFGRRRRSRVVPLPSHQQVREEFTRMVEFGPRLTPSTEHNNYVAWLDDEFERAWLQVPPPDPYTTDRWLAQEVALDILQGPAAGPVKLSTYYTRSKETTAQGLSGPLVYGGTAPALSAS